MYLQLHHFCLQFFSFFFFFFMMSPGGGNGEGFLWDVPEWVFSNAENDHSSDPKAAAAAVVKAPPVVGSSSNSPTGLGRPPVAKRGRNGGAAAKGSSSGKQEGKSGSGGGGVGESDHEIHIWTERERRKRMRNMFSSLHSLLPHLSPKADKSTIVDEAVGYIKTLQQKLHCLQQHKLERLRCDDVPPSSSSSSILLQQLRSPASSETTLITREAFLADVPGAAKNKPPLPPPAAGINSPSTAAVVSAAARFPLSFHTWSSPNVVLSVTGGDAHISICAARKPGLFSAVLCVMEKHSLELVSATVSSDCFRSIIMIHARAAGGVCDELPETLIVEEIYKLAVGDMIICLSA